MIRDTSSWPEVLREALEPGIAPTLDELAEETKRVFWLDVSMEEAWPSEPTLVVRTLGVITVEVLAGISDEVLLQALRELWGLNEYAILFGLNFDSAVSPKDCMFDILISAVETRARLDEAVEREEIERRGMLRLSQSEAAEIVDAEKRSERERFASFDACLADWQRKDE